VYSIVALIYFFLAFDVDEDNIISITITLLVFTILILIMYFIMFSAKGCHTFIVLE
jgi:hypothetical protein